MLPPLCFYAGVDPGFKKRGRGHNTLFFRTAASLESRASPKKADERGGGGEEGGGDPDTVFFGAPPASKFVQVPNKLMSGGGGVNSTHLCAVFVFVLFFAFKRGRGAHGPDVPPPPKSATGFMSYTCQFITKS